MVSAEPQIVVPARQIHKCAISSADSEVAQCFMIFYVLQSSDSEAKGCLRPLLNQTVDKAVLRYAVLPHLRKLMWIDEISVLKSAFLQWPNKFESPSFWLWWNSDFNGISMDFLWFPPASRWIQVWQTTKWKAITWVCWSCLNLTVSGEFCPSDWPSDRYTRLFI